MMPWQWRQGATAAVRVEFAFDLDEFVATMTAQARGITRVAVQLDDAFIGNARDLMQVVDVLCDHRSGLALLDEIRNDLVSAIGLRSDPAVTIVETASPRLATLLLGGDELLEINRLHARPHAARTAEIGNAGFGADAGAREKQGAAAVTKQLSEESSDRRSWC